MTYSISFCTLYKSDITVTTSLIKLGITVSEMATTIISKKNEAWHAYIEEYLRLQFS